MTYWTRTQRADGATAYGHTTPKRPTPSYLRDYHNDDTRTTITRKPTPVCPQSPKHVTWPVPTPEDLLKPHIPPALNPKPRVTSISPSCREHSALSLAKHVSKDSGTQH